MQGIPTDIPNGRLAAAAVQENACTRMSMHTGPIEHQRIRIPIYLDILLARYSIGHCAATAMRSNVNAYRAGPRCHRMPIAPPPRRARMRCGALFDEDTVQPKAADARSP